MCSSDLGAFKGKSAANYVANVLNMGRATVYKHLKEIKGDYHRRISATLIRR